MQLLLCGNMIKVKTGWQRIGKKVHELISRQLSVEKKKNPQRRSMASSRSNLFNLEEPDKSEGDKKLYRALKLPNGLRALLISDPIIPEDPTNSSTDRSIKSGSVTSSVGQYHGKLAACAVLVDVGSFSEPPEYQGLAHFVEHMIFMGSDKYPAENAFDAFVTKSGGFSNAHTENEETCFYFEVEEAHFDKSLDMFMNLMRAPLMREESMMRERSAVQSEFEQTHMEDEVRRDQLMASFATDGYPQGTFSWGNLKSLQENVNDHELYKALHDFHQKHYGSNRMIVCLQASMSLNELEELLLRHCADLPNSTESALDGTKYRYDQAFREQLFTDVFLVLPVDDMCKVELTWVLPSMLPYYRSKPADLLSFLMGYEGKDSLCAYLRRRLWGMTVLVGINSSSFELNSIYSLFCISLFLTDEGFSHLDEVMAATFAWLKLFQQNQSDLQRSYNELQQIAATNFKFKIEQPAIDNVQDVIHNLKYIETKDVLTGPELFFEYDDGAIQLLLQHLNEFKFNIMISSHIPYEDYKYDQVEKWFGTIYKTIPMPEKWIEMWMNPPYFPDLSFPSPNPFISTDFRIHFLEEGRKHIPRRPKHIIKNDLCELWFRQDDTFLLPDGFISIYFITPVMVQSARDYMLGVLYTYLVEFSIAEELYPALEAGLSYALFCGEKGLVLRVSGYNEKLPLLVEIILSVMRSLEVDPPQLMSFIELKRRQIFSALISARSLSQDLRLTLLENRRFSMIDKYDALSGINVDEMKSFMNEFPKKMYIQALIQGNFPEIQALNMMETVLATFNSQKIDNIELLNNQIFQLPLGAHFLRVKNLNDQDTNSIVTNYYQLGPSNLRKECIMDLVELIVEEPFFNKLRTQEQLGYSLGFYQRIAYGILAFLIAVNTQETKFTSEYVEQRIESFRGEMAKLIDELSEEDFMDVRESLINNKKLGDTSLEDEVGRNWSEIVTLEYFFNRTDMQVNEVNKLSKQDLLDFLKDYENNDFRKLTVQIIGRDSPPIRSPSNSIGSAISLHKGSSTQELSRRSGSLSELLSEVKQTISMEQLLFEQIGNKIKLEFIGDSKDPRNILDIAEFKKTLNLYPFINTNPKLTNNL